MMMFLKNYVLSQYTLFLDFQSVIIIDNALIYYNKVNFILFILHKFSDDDLNILITISVFIRSVMK